MQKIILKTKPLDTFLQSLLEKFVRFVEIVAGFEKPAIKEVAPEDLRRNR